MTRFAFLRSLIGQILSLTDLLASAAFSLASPIDTSGHRPSPISRRLPSMTRRMIHFPRALSLLTSQRPWPSANFPAGRLLAFICDSAFVFTVYLLVHPSASDFVIQGGH